MENASVHGLSPLIMDLIQVLSWMAAIAAGIVAASKALRETRENRDLRREELRWRKAQLAREVLKDIRDNPAIRSAGLMLDWTGREFEILPGIRASITWPEMNHALRTQSNGGFSDKEAFIRDCFDSLFDTLEQVEHYLRTGLIEFEDVSFPLEYYVAQLREREDVIYPFLAEYGYDLGKPFLERFGVKRTPNPSPQVDG
jgi:hypothetical protein